MTTDDEENTLKYMIDDIAKAYRIDPCENKIELLMAIGCKMQFLWDLSRMSVEKIAAMEEDVRTLRLTWEMIVAQNRQPSADMFKATIKLLDSLPAIGGVK